MKIPSLPSVYVLVGELITGLECFGKYCHHSRYER